LHIYDSDDKWFFEKSKTLFRNRKGSKYSVLNVEKKTSTMFHFAREGIGRKT